jgi:hypothetical protein
MAITSTGYGLNHGNAFAGMVADDQVSNVVTKTNITATTVPYGKGVVRDTTTNTETGIGTIATTTTAAMFVGVAVRELNRAYNTGDTFGAVPAKDFSVLTAGTIWVTVRETVVPGDAACLIINATNPGDFKKTAGGNDAVAITGAKFLTGATTGNLAKLSLVVGG